MYPMIAVTLNQIYQLEKNKELAQNELPKSTLDI
jgi:hypothetical protein